MSNRRSDHARWALVGLVSCLASWGALLVLGDPSHESPGSPRELAAYDRWARLWCILAIPGILGFLALLSGIMGLAEDWLDRRRKRDR